MNTDQTEKPSRVTHQDVPGELPPNVVASDASTGVVEKGGKPSDPGHVDDNHDDEGDDDQPGDGTGDDGGRKEPRRRKRRRGANSEVLRQIAELKSTQATLQEQNAALKAQLDADAERARASLPAPKRPKLSDFKTEEQFAEAWDEYNVALAKRNAPATPKPKQPAPESRGSVIPKAVMDDFHAQGEKTYGKEEWDELLKADIPVDESTAVFLAASGKAGPIVYAHLADNPAAALELSLLSPENKSAKLTELRKLARAGKLDDGSSDDDDDDGEGKPAPRAAPSNTETARRTKAPEPPTASRTTSRSPTQVDLDAMNPEAYAAHRMNQERRRRGLPPI